MVELSEKIQIRVRPEVKELIEEKSKKSISNFMRTLIYEKFGREISKKSHKMNRRRPEPILKRLRRKLRSWTLRNCGKEPLEIIREAYLLAQKEKEKKEELRSPGP